MRCATHAVRRRPLIDVQRAGQLQQQPDSRLAGPVLQPREVPDRDTRQLRQLCQRQILPEPVTANQRGDPLIVVAWVGPSKLPFGVLTLTLPIVVRTSSILRP